MQAPIRKMIVYVDGTEQSITAAQYAICLSKTSGARLIALYVVNTRALHDLVKARIFLKDEQQDYQHDIEEDAERYLNHVQNMARKKGLAIETLSASGTVHIEIKNAVEAAEADLLIIGELSKIRSRRDELHNEVERAMRNVSCSVLIVKNEDYVFDLFEALR